MYCLDAKRDSVDGNDDVKQHHPYHPDDIYDDHDYGPIMSWFLMMAMVGPSVSSLMAAKTVVVIRSLVLIFRRFRSRVFTRALIGTACTLFRFCVQSIRCVYMLRLEFKILSLGIFPCGTGAQNTQKHCLNTRRSPKPCHPDPSTPQKI